MNPVEDMSETKLKFREIERDDNQRIAEIIRACLEEFGAVGPGFAWSDPEVDTMYETYQGDRAIYLLVETDGAEVMGGGGIGPLLGGAPETCELQKMYFDKAIRGQGMGKKLLTELLQSAREFGYRKCYLETLQHMDAANGLYRKLGFEPVPQPLGNTGHCGCDYWYVKDLEVDP